MTNSQSDITVACPTCRKSVIWSAEALFKPFCSERCKLIDLGDWATEAFKIPGSTLMQEQEENDHDFSG